MRGINSKTRKDKYKLEIYGIDIHVLINYTADKVNRDYITYNEEELSSVDNNIGSLLDGKAMHWGILKDRKTKQKVSIICINTEEHDDIFDLIDSAAHESFHAASTLCDYVGMPLGRDSEEAYAYLCGYITRCVYKTLFKKK